MFKSPSLTRKQITNGVYEGVYTSQSNTTSPPSVILTFLGETLGDASAEPLDELAGTWLLRCNIPPEAISDGIQTFLLCNVDGNTVLDSFSIVAGEPLDDDLRNEINLLREELDMLKRAFRRHCVETMG
jgi:hypothetical protein